MNLGTENVYQMLNVGTLSSAHGEPSLQVLPSLWVADWWELIDFMEPTGGREL